MVAQGHCQLARSSTHTQRYAEIVARSPLHHSTASASTSTARQKSFGSYLRAIRNRPLSLWRANHPKFIAECPDNILPLHKENHSWYKACKNRDPSCNEPNNYPSLPRWPLGN